MTLDGFEVWPRAFIHLGLLYRDWLFGRSLGHFTLFFRVGKTRLALNCCRQMIWFGLENHHFGFLLALVRWYILIEKETSAWLFSLLVLFVLPFEFFALNRKSDKSRVRFTCKYTFYHIWMVWDKVQPLRPALKWNTLLFTQQQPQPRRVCV